VFLVLAVHESTQTLFQQNGGLARVELDALSGFRGRGLDAYVKQFIEKEGLAKSRKSRQRGDVVVKVLTAFVSVKSARSLRFSFSTPRQACSLQK